MKKITLLLIFLYSLSGHCQVFPENFEASTSLPAGWNQYQNPKTGLSQKWKILNSQLTACNGSSKAASIIGDGGIPLNTKVEYYLTTPQFTVPANGQVRFMAKQGNPGDQGSTLELRISASADPSDVGSYLNVGSWTESDLSAMDASGSDPICHELKATIDSSYIGLKVYMAFVRVYTQASSDLKSSGDRWSVDNVDVVSQCADPTLGVASKVSATTATLDWTDATGSIWDIEYVLAGNAQTGTPTVSGIKSKPYNATNLTPDMAYTYYIRSVCSSTNTSNWTGPFTFKTYPLGALCDDALTISTLPYQAASNTGNFPNLLNGPQNSSSLCGADPADIDYLAGNDVFYSYTATETGLISIKLTPTGPNSSVFVYGSCPISGPCLAGVANSDSTQRFINNFPVTAASTYIIVISSAKASPTVGYTLVIQKEPCTSPEGSSPIGTDLTTTTAKLSWTNPTGAKEWQVAVQSLGSPLPTDPGEIVTVSPFLKTGLKAATQYQYYVRAKCSDGQFSSWAGPYFFSTLMCEDADKCLYTFKMTSSQTTGWAGATMQVRQNGIVIQSIGSTFNSGAGPATVMIPMCKDLPFDLYWDTAGLQPNNCEVAIINSFGQTLFTKVAGMGSPDDILYNNAVNCTKAVCDIPPISLDATPTVHEATLSWSAPATTAWDVYVVPAGSPAPTVLTTPTYPAIITNPLTITGLLADTCYDYYARVVCDTKSDWSSVFNFCTLPTCLKPTGLTASGTTKTGATLSWTNGSTEDTQWEILLVKAVAPGYGVPAVPTASYVLQPGDKLYTPTSAIPSTASPFAVNDLETGTMYYYYVRTICPGNDKSVWAGPAKFNTTICDPADKCKYIFRMTDTGGNGWENGRMLVRQNGIVIGTIGSSITAATPAGVSVDASVSLCSNVPIDLMWNIAGAHPAEIGVQVLNPSGDPIYTKLPGDGNPLDILFASTVNCKPPTCPKPTSVTVANVTATTADLGWTENAVPGATQWEVYVVPTGSAQPINGSPVTGVQPYYKTSTNPFTITNLNPSDTYDFYVRSICSGTDSSTWTLLNPKTFTTTPPNDECANSIPVPVNSDENCLVKVSGNTKGATGSIQNSSCQGFADDDVWFSFVATSTIHVIEINNIVGGTTDLNHAIYSGNDCANPTLLYCSNPNSSVLSNLTIGNTYRIRVYTNDMTSQSATFDVCITTPPPITNDDCNTAMALVVNNELPCAQSKSGSLTGASASLQANTCIGTADDDVWYKFVATTQNQYIMLSNVTGSSMDGDKMGYAIDVNHAVYTGDCGNLILKYCSADNSMQSTAYDFVPGQTYYVRVWSNLPYRQKINFDICIGSAPPPIITSTTKYTTQQLVEDVLLGSKCAKVTNIHSSTGTDFSDVNGIGYFNKSFSGFPFKEGIVLSSGDALKAPGPNYSLLKDGRKTWPGDVELENIIEQAVPNQIVQSYNASVLEFDFTPLSDKLSFNFLFASEEYGSEQCGFADTFAFILSHTENGQTIKENLAVIPTTKLPVSVLTIRDNKYNAQCPAEHPELFGQYYDYGGIDPSKDPTNYEGCTVPLTAQGKVIPGLTYHIKMVIADNRDTVWDSAVFLEGGSFDVGKMDLGPDLLQVTRNALCPETKYVIDSGLDPAKYTFVWSKDNLVISTETGPSLGIDSPGNYTVQAHYLAGVCDTTDSIVIEYYPGAAPGSPLPLALCSSSDKATFDFISNSAVILSPFNGDHTVDYYTSLDDANAQDNLIADPTAFQNTVNPQTIFARVNMTDTGCYQMMTFTTTATLNPQFTVSGNMKVCATETTTITVVPTNNSFDPSTATYTWAFNGTVIPTETGSSITLKGTASVGNYTITVNNAGCTASQDFVITENTDVINIEIQSGCLSNNYKLTAVPVSGSFDPATAAYEWTASNGGTFKTTDQKNTIILTSIGTYNVKVTTADGCSSDQSITVTDITCSIPKGISPDGDKLNDNFDLSTLNVKRLEIFNRYGTEVYSLDNYTNQWHGQTNGGSELPDGTYFYQLHISENKIASGWVYINRKQ